MDYRSAAKDALRRAKQEFNSDDYRLKYAALELRMAFESLVYERASCYTEELSSKKLSTWQPGQLLKLLLQIDPDADKNTELSVGIQEEQGKPAEIMTPLGKERVLSLKEIKKYYDRLGSYLHAPTLDQVGKGATPETIRTRCSEIVEILEQVLASPIFNTNFRVISEIFCKKCNTKIVRRMPYEVKSVIAECIECSASYKLTDVGNDKVEWSDIVQDIKCPNTDCNYINKIWDRDIQLGKHWVCAGCGSRNQIILAVTCFNMPTDQENRTHQ